MYIHHTKTNTVLKIYFCITYFTMCFCFTKAIIRWIMNNTEELQRLQLCYNGLTDVMYVGSITRFTMLKENV
jgi:hypothetical protein